MKNRFTFLIAFCLMAFAASAQLVDVVTGVSKPWSLALDGNDLYIGLDGSGGKVIKIDITQQNPMPTDVFTGLGTYGQGGLYLDGNDLYIGEYNYGKVVKLDISQPNPTPSDVVTVSSPFSILKSGNYLYVGTEFSGIKKIDLTNTANIVSYPATLGFIGGMALKGEVLYYSDGYPGGGAVYKIDESLPNPTASLVVSGLDTPYGLTLNGNFLYVAEHSEIRKLDLGQTMPQPVTVVSGLNGGRLTEFDGLDMYVTQYNADKVSKLTIGQPEFPTQSTICTNAVPTDLGGASPSGGSYSGTGVTDDGNGETFTFDPAAAGGPGTYTITYTATNGSTATSTLTVVAPPTVMITPPSSVTVDAGAQTGLSGGTPSGGVYSGTGITDDGNGMTYTFDPMAAGVGTHTITYSYTDGNGCSGMASGIITVQNPLPPDNACGGANDINALFGTFGQTITSGLWDNTDYTSDGDPAVNLGTCFFSSDPLQHTVWFSFTGNGKTYRIRTVQCNATNYITDGDTQVAIYSGNCSNPTFVACNEDEDANGAIYNIEIDIDTESGTEYFMLIDGYGGAQGEFCLEVANLSPSAVTEISGTDIQVFPNPTSGMVQLINVNADQIQVFDNVGRLVLQVEQPGNSISIENAPAGMYFLKIKEGEQVYSARVVKE